MNLAKIKQVIKLFDNPEWALRSPDQQQAPSPVTPAPIKQGGIPTPASAAPSPKPSKMNPQAIKKAADSLLMGEEGQQGSANPSAIPGMEGGANTSLSNALRMRRLSRNTAQNTPGSIGYLTGGQ